MAAIKHYLVISSKPEVVYKALTTQIGLAGWWTRECIAEPVVGSTAEFVFGSQYRNKMKILKLTENNLIEWENFEGDEEWIGTKFKFELEKKDGSTIVRFSHFNWRDETDFFASCNYHWGYYMRSLKQYCETGTGTPYK